MIIHLFRVIDVLRTWIERHYYDLDAQPEFVRRMSKFLKETVAAKFPDEAQKLLDTLHLKKKEFEEQKVSLFMNMEWNTP
jgi:hypothetical protein